jgi:hypothetical protein
VGDNEAGCPTLATFLFLSLGWETTNAPSVKSGLYPIGWRKMVFSFSGAVRRGSLR